MGQGYGLICQKCGYACTIHLGSGFFHPRHHENILEEMKKGVHGKRFMKDASTIPNVAIHHGYEVFVCTHCGRWKEAEAIDLCVTKRDDKKSNGKLPVTGNLQITAPYVEAEEIGKKYVIVRSKSYRCSNCRHAMRKTKNHAKLKCPECGNKLDFDGTFLRWD